MIDRTTNAACNCESTTQPPHRRHQGVAVPGSQAMTHLRPGLTEVENIQFNI
jgi:hypothetical protein